MTRHASALTERILALIKEGERVYADETTLPTLSPGSGRTKTAWLWTYARDDRTFGGRLAAQISQNVTGVRDLLNPTLTSLARDALSLIGLVAVSLAVGTTTVNVH